MRASKSKPFVDSVRLFAIAGDGGDGVCSFRREKFLPKGGPSGGDGGDGGDVILEAHAETASLLPLFYQPHQKAERGTHGKGKSLYGKAGASRTAFVPCGTEVWHATKDILLADLVEPGQQYLAARGGKGGLGNEHWVSPTNQAPMEFTTGEPGETAELRLELKMVTDVALVGYPNAGKSSLLASISHAHPRVAAYPFTTLHPVVGTVVFDDFTSLKALDVPGLIDDAHAGRGLGHAFLHHIERARFLLVVLDMASSEGRDPADDYRNVTSELAMHRPELAERDRLVVANKMDLPDGQGFLDFFRDEFPELEVIPVSTATGDGIEDLKAALHARRARITGKTE